MERGWGGGSHRLSSVCQALGQVGSCISRHLLTTYYMPGSVLSARDSGVNKNSVSAVLERIPYLSGT